MSAVYRHCEGDECNMHTLQFLSVNVSRSLDPKRQQAPPCGHHYNHSSSDSDSPQIIKVTPNACKDIRLTTSPLSCLACGMTSPLAHIAGPQQPHHRWCRRAHRPGSPPVCCWPRHPKLPVVPPLSPLAVHSGPVTAAVAAPAAPGSPAACRRRWLPSGTLTAAAGSPWRHLLRRVTGVRCVALGGRAETGAQSGEGHFER